MAVTAPPPGVTSKTCKRCGAKKQLSEFARHPTGRFGHRPDCKVCRRVFVNAAYNGGGERARAMHLSRQRKHRYGLATPEYEAFIKARGACEICGASERLVVDHDHVAKRLRGVLCANCNNALGLFKERPQVIEAALRYVRGGGSSL